MVDLRISTNRSNRFEVFLRCPSSIHLLLNFVENWFDTLNKVEMKNIFRHFSIEFYSRDRQTIESKLDDHLSFDYSTMLKKKMKISPNDVDEADKTKQNEVKIVSFCDRFYFVRWQRRSCCDRFFSYIRFCWRFVHRLFWLFEKYLLVVVLDAQLLFFFSFWFNLQVKK